MKIIIKRTGLLRRQWRVRIIASNGKQLFVSGDGYRNRADAIHVAELIRRDAAHAKLIIEGEV